MKNVFFCLLAVCCMGCGASNSGVNLIFDTDMAPDYDDVGALAILHAMADSGEVNILATVSSNQWPTAAPCIDVLNTFFGRPDIPVGAPKGEAPSRGTWHGGIKWTEELPARYPHKIKSTAESEDALKLYRRILSEQKDNSVTIVTVGFLTNLRNLMNSGPDEYSKLNGMELIRKKVKLLVSMAGHFPEGREFNVYIDPEASKFVFDNWPTEILFSGWEIGSKIFTGRKLHDSGITGNPVIDTFTWCLPQDDMKGRDSWDETSVLVAVRGPGEYFDVERGTIVLDEDGNNKWAKDDNGKHMHLKFKMTPAQITDVIQDMMMHQPQKTKTSSK